MNRDQYRSFLISKLPIAKSASGGREIVTRCQYCPDSKNPSKGHFYISIPMKDDEPSYFYCQKCGSFGAVTPKKLIEWGIYDPEIGIDLDQHNRAIFKNNPMMKSKNSEVYNILYDRISEDKLTEYKLKYVMNRLGIQLSYQDCIREKIVLNLHDVIDRNHLKPTRYPNVMDSLDTGFVGFLSYDNAFVNMRNLGILKDIPSNVDKRYINYNLFDKIDNTKRFYTIPNTIDIMNSKPIQIHVAEGPFDILSVYHNLRQDLYQHIYVAMGGKRYLGILKFFINIMKLINIEVHLYLDGDIEHWVVDRVKEVLYPFYIPIYVHRNIYPGEKDFGVPLNKIKESVEIL